MIRRPPNVIPTDTLFTYTTLFRSLPLPSKSGASCPSLAPPARKLPRSVPFPPTATHRLAKSSPTPWTRSAWKASLPLKTTNRWKTNCRSSKACISTAAICRPTSSTNLTSRRSEEHTSDLQSLIRTTYAVFCLTQNYKYSTFFCLFILIPFFCLFFMYHRHLLLLIHSFPTRRSSELRFLVRQQRRIDWRNHRQRHGQGRQGRRYYR